MRRLAKNLILATTVVSAIFIVDLSSAGAVSLHCEKSCRYEKIYPVITDTAKRYLDFWSKFRDTVMPDPEEPQNNNPPKEMKKPKPDEKTPSPDESKPSN